MLGNENFFPSGRSPGPGLTAGYFPPAGGSSAPGSTAGICVAPAIDGAQLIFQDLVAKPIGICRRRADTDIPVFVRRRETSGVYSAKALA